MSSVKERDMKLYESLINKYGKPTIIRELKRMNNNKSQVIDESTRIKRDKKLYESLVNKYGPVRINQELKKLKDSENDEIIIEC